MVGLQPAEGLFDEHLVQRPVEGEVLLGDLDELRLLRTAAGGAVLVDDEVAGGGDEVGAQVRSLAKGADGIRESAFGALGAAAVPARSRSAPRV